jgi:HEAT repeat protein
MTDILQKLTGGDRRSIGRSDEVVADVLADPALFGILFEGMLSDDPLVRMRAADAVEKITARRPDYLRPYKTRLLEEVAAVEQQEVRWHLAQIFSRLELDSGERATVYAILLTYLEDESKIVKTFSMQALADLAGQDETYRPLVIAILEKQTAAGSPAMQSRGRVLLKKLSA